MRSLFLAAFIILVVYGASGARATTTVETSAAATVETSAWSHESLGTIDPRVFDLALGAARCAMRSGAIADPSTLTVIDYSKPSTEKRLWVFDLRSRELLYEELVAHGQGSGDNLANVFSNQPDTHASSLGLFLTDDTYVGRNGYSLRLNGTGRRLQRSGA